MSATTTPTRPRSARLVPAIKQLAFPRVAERNVRAYRRNWPILVSGLVEPVMMLLAIGIGVGSLVGDVDVDGRAVDYAQFVAPAMLATSAMTAGIAESTFNFFVKLKYAKTYDSMLATPLRPRDVVQGEAAWAVARCSIYAGSFLVVMVLFGLTPSWWAVLTFPVGALVGFAFAGAGLGATSYMRSFVDFDFVFLAMTPLLLLSGTFFPLERYPDAVEMVVRFTPLYQGVTLCRSLTLGDVHIGLIWHAVYLGAMGTLGLRVATRRLAKLLLP